MDDISESVIKSAAKGDVGAFETIYRASCGFVYNVALRVSANRTKAQDITQEVFLKVYDSLKFFSFRSKLKTWIYRVTVNTAINYCRQDKSRGKSDVDFSDIEPLTGSHDSIREEIDRKDSAVYVRGLLDKLNPEHKACLLLREFEGLSYEEMAKVLKVKLNTVRSRLKRAREALVLCHGQKGAL